MLFNYLLTDLHKHVHAVFVLLHSVLYAVVTTHRDSASISSTANATKTPLQQTAHQHAAQFMTVTSGEVDATTT